VGDLDADVGGRLGLWQICQKDELTDTCTGKLEDLMSMPSVAFQVSFIFKEVSCESSYAIKKIISI
jgi:LHFPL tetraspan subfamily member protein